MRGTVELIAHTGKLLRGGRSTSNSCIGTIGTNQDCVGVNEKVSHHPHFTGEKVRHPEVKSLVHGHIAGEWRSQNSNPG